MEYSEFLKGGFHAWPLIGAQSYSGQIPMITCKCLNCFCQTPTPIKCLSAVANIIYGIGGGVAGAPKIVSRRRLELF